MPTLELNISLTAQQVKTIYEGQTRFILATSSDGLKVQLPALNFRPFVTLNGIHGRFRVSVDANNKIRKLEKL